MNVYPRSNHWLQIPRSLCIAMGIIGLPAQAQTPTTLASQICDPKPVNVISQDFNPSRAKAPEIDLSSLMPLTPQPKLNSAADFYQQTLRWRQVRSPQENIAFLNRSIDLAPNYVEAYSKRAEEYMAQKAYHLALADYDRLQQLQPNLPRFLRQKANLYAHQKQWQKVAQLYLQLLNQEPDRRFEHHLTLGQIYLELQDWEQAIDHFSRAIAQRNYSARVVKPIPSGNWKLPFSPSPQPSFVSLESSAFSNPGLPLSGELYLRRARVYAIQKRAQQAIDDYHSAIKNVGPGNWRTTSQIYHERCYVRVGFGDLTGAKADAQTSRQLTQWDLQESRSQPKISISALPMPTPEPPSRPNSDLSLQIHIRPKAAQLTEEVTRFLTRLSKTTAWMPAEPIETLRQAIVADPNYAPAYYTRGLIHLRIYDFRAAIEDFNTAIRLNPTFSLAYSARGKTYFEGGQFAEALADFEQALSIDPTLTAAHLGKGLVLLEKQQWQSAASSLSQALETDPELLNALDGRAKARKELNDLAGMLTDQKRSQRLRDRSKS